MAIIYKSTNLLDGKIYVGQQQFDKKGYFGSGKVIKLVIDKHGKKNFKKEILEEIDSSDQEFINEREIFWIKKLDATNRDVGYNISEGGQGHWIKGNKTKEHLRKIGEANKISQLGNKNGTSNKGRKHTEEAKRRISEGGKGLKRTKETRENIRKALTGKKFTEEHKAALRRGWIKRRNRNKL